MPDDSRPPTASNAPAPERTSDTSTFAEEQTASHTVVGLLTDPDLPGELARHLRDILPGELGRRVDDRIDWRVEIRYDPFEAMYPDYGYLIDKGHEHVRNTNWDLALCLTDVPLRDDDDSQVLVASVEPQQRVALISVPAARWRRSATQSAPTGRADRRHAAVRRCRSGCAAVALDERSPQRSGSSVW